MNNDDKHIESLLDLFMKGETTLEQERELKQYFSDSQAIPKEWEPFKEMMAYFDAGMPIKTASSSRPRIARPLWTVAVAAAAAIATIVIMVAPHLSRSPKATPSITVDADTPKSHSAIDSTPSSPIIAKAERTDIALENPKMVSHKIKHKHKDIASFKSTVNAVEIEREKGEIEQTQQELMADQFIIEQERQEILAEQYSQRAQAQLAQQAFINENPQLIQVVFK